MRVCGSVQLHQLLQTGADLLADLHRTRPPSRPSHSSERLSHLHSSINFYRQQQIFWQTSTACFWSTPTKLPLTSTVPFHHYQHHLLALFLLPPVRPSPSSQNTPSPCPPPRRRKVPKRKALPPPVPTDTNWDDWDADAECRLVELKTYVARRVMATLAAFHNRADSFPVPFTLPTTTVSLHRAYASHTISPTITKNLEPVQEHSLHPCHPPSLGHRPEDYPRRGRTSNQPFTTEAWRRLNGRCWVIDPHNAIVRGLAWSADATPPDM